MSWQLLWLASAVLCAAAAFMLFRKLYVDSVRHHPLVLHLSERARSRAHHEFGLNIESNFTLGKIGELITALMHTADGWQQIPSQPDGVHGIAGIFVRRLANSSAYEVRFVETAASREGDGPGRFDDQRMSDDKIKDAIDALHKQMAADDAPYLSQADATALKRAIEHHSLHVSKLHFHHNLAAGRTRIYNIRRDGSLVLNPEAMPRVENRTHKFMLQSLAINLGRLDEVGFKAEEDRRVSLSPEPAQPSAKLDIAA